MAEELKRGDKLCLVTYRIEDDKIIPTLTQAVFLQESVADGASVPTWVVKNIGGGFSRCRVGYYHRTEEQAWRAYYEELGAAVQPAVDKVNAAQRRLLSLLQERFRAAGVLADLMQKETKCQQP